MKYENIKKGIFVSRPNRFKAHVIIDGKEEIVHVKNTGRCKEILKSGATVILEKAKNPDRKTMYSLIAGYKGDLLINIDSQVVNQVVYDGILEGRIEEFPKIKILQKEKVYGNSRFDLYFESESRKGFIEVKGVTLEKDGLTLFPDAPTERGTKHVYEMVKAVRDGYLGYIFFLVQMKGPKLFTPHREMDADFAEALCEAKKAGVNIVAYDSLVTEDEIVIGSRIEVCL